MEISFALKFEFGGGGFGSGAGEKIVKTFERIFCTWDGEWFLMVRVKIVEGADWGNWGCRGCGSEQWILGLGIRAVYNRDN